MIDFYHLDDETTQKINHISDNGANFLFYYTLFKLSSLFSLSQVYEDEPVLKAFQLMRKKGIGGLPVVDGSGNRAIGNISIRDVQYLLTAPEMYKDYRSVAAILLC